MKSEVLSNTNPLSSFPSSPSPTRSCSICGAPSNGYHFNAPSCSACAAFFRRTVTLDRKFSCAQNGMCKVDYTMRVICRACRYTKCIDAGMERKAVQPRRDCNQGRRKIHHSTRHQTVKESHDVNTNYANQYDQLTSVMDTSGMDVSPDSTFNPIFPPFIDPLDDIPHCNPGTSPESFPNTPIPPMQWNNVQSSFPSPPHDPTSCIEDLLREERLYNERRKLLYCGRSSISKLLSVSEINDIPFSDEDTQELTFDGVRKDIRPQILLVYEWIRGWKHFPQLSIQDRKTFLRRCILYHTILDPAYLTVRLGYPDRFVMFNGMFVGIEDSSVVGWQDEKGVISTALKKELYRPLMDRVVNEIVIPMKQIDLTYTEYVILKGLVSFKSASVYDVEASTRDLMNAQIDSYLLGLHTHYKQNGLDPQQIAERTGNLVLLMSSIFAVSMECLESHQKIQFFDLWEIDDLLLQLLTRSGGVKRSRSTSSCAGGTNQHPSNNEASPTVPPGPSPTQYPSCSQPSTSSYGATNNPSISINTSQFPSCSINNAELFHNAPTVGNSPRGSSQGYPEQRNTFTNSHYHERTVSSSDSTTYSNSNLSPMSTMGSTFGHSNPMVGGLDTNALTPFPSCSQGASPMVSSSLLSPGNINEQMSPTLRSCEFSTP